jgi:hypothetical protein
MYGINPLLDNARNTRGQQQENSVFFVRERAVAVQKPRCDVTQQYVTVTRHVSFANGRDDVIDA